MNGNIFLDTNIIIYSYSNNDIRKQKIARDLISNTHTFISTQVLQELINTLTKKFLFSYAEAAKVFDECIKNNFVYINNAETIKQAVLLSDRFKYTFYDSLIISSALSSDCIFLYSEDMHDGQLINDKLRILNPFA